MIVTELNGIVTISNKKFIQQPAIISTLDVLKDDSIIPFVNPDEVMYGGSFLSGTKHIFNNLRKYATKDNARKVINVGKTLDPFVEMVAPRLHGAYDGALSWADKLVGEGLCTKADIKRMKAGKYNEKHFKDMYLNGGNVCGGNNIGGKLLPKSKLKQRALDYDI